MVTMAQVHAQGSAEEACTRAANGDGFCWVTVDVFNHMFPGIPVGAYQTITHDGTDVHVATSGAGVPPHVKW